MWIFLALLNFVCLDSIHQQPFGYPSSHYNHPISSCYSGTCQILQHECTCCPCLVDAEEVDADSLFGLRVQVGVDPLKEVGSLEEAGPLKEADPVEEVDLATEELLEVLVVSFVPGVLHFVWP